MTGSADKVPVIWAIGGVDSLGVAGILADARAAQACKVHCATIVSCVTAQNSERFIESSATAVELLDAQWQALAEQTVPSVIKIGLLVNVAQVQWLADKLAELRSTQPDLRVIYDPVLVSSSKRALVSLATLDVIKELLLAQVDLLTPNIDEAQQLTGLTISDRSDLVALARTLSISFELSVLVKGGHLALNDTAYDCYIGAINAIDPREPATSFVMASPLQSNDNIRGTGCTLASLIASQLAQGYTLCDALVLAKASINQAIAAAKPVGNSRGGLVELTPPRQAKYLPTVYSLNQFLDGAAVEISVEVQAFAPTEQHLGLYAVVNTVAWLERLLRLGVKTIQLRCKDFCDQEIEPQIIEAIALGRQYQVRLFINDYWQLAVKHQAYGVHLGQEDLQLADLDLIKRAGLRLGLSTHGVFEAIVADQLQPSYIALGHIFATQTKDMPSTPQGLEKLSLQVELFKYHRPLVAIGGISQNRVQGIVDTSIGSVALVTAITNAGDVDQVTSALLAQVGCGDVPVGLAACTGGVQ